MGIHKSIEAIRSAVVLLDTVKIKKLLRNARETKSMTELAGSGAAGTTAKQSTRKSVAMVPNKNRAAELERGPAALQLERNLIEDLQDDKLFLLELLSDTRLCQSCNGEIEQLVNEGLDYIETRVEFWRQGNPNGANIATVKAAVMGSKLNLAHEELVALKGKKRIAPHAIKTGGTGAVVVPAGVGSPRKSKVIPR